MNTQRRFQQRFSKRTLRTKILGSIIGVYATCIWFYFHDGRKSPFEPPEVKSAVPGRWEYEAKELPAEIKQGDGTTDAGYCKTENASIRPSQFSTTVEVLSTAETRTPKPTPTPSLPDRIVVMAKTPNDNTDWVSELPNWESAIYHIDTSTPHNTSTLDPMTNSTLRTLRNKGTEANAYLAYIIQNYDNLASTIAFVHPHKDGYPIAWHTDNALHSNVISLQRLNIHFVQKNGYANLRCIHDPGCPQEVMPFRDPPEAHRTIEAAMPNAWRDLFNNTNVPRILATPCCAQFAVSREQVRKVKLEEYKKYYRWLMRTELEDATSGRVFEYLWHIIFGQNPVYCPELYTCYCDVYNQC